MNFKLFFTAILLICFTGINNAQIDLGKIARDAKRTVNKRVDRNIDKAIDNTLDETEDAIKGKNKKKKNKGEDDYYDEKGGTTVIKEVIPNSFAGQFMITRDIEGGSQESNMYTIAMQEYETAIRPLMVKTPHNLIIYDKENETKTTINTVKYEGKALRDWVMREEVSEKKYAKAERTDEIEDIDGYIARKYTVKAKEYEGEVWFTKEIDADLGIINYLLELDELFLDPKLGFPLKMNLSFDDGYTEIFKVTDINETADQSLFDISQYNLVDMTDLESGK